MSPRLHIFLSLCTIATTVLACGNGSSAPAFSNSSGGVQLGGSSSSAGGVASTTNSSSSTLTGGTQSTGGGATGGTTNTGTSTGGTTTGGTIATGGSSTSAVGGASGTAKGGTTSGGANGGTSTTINGGSSGSQPKGGSGGIAGGAAANGGASTTGGSVAAGGSVATGGAEATGGASACSWSSAPSSEDGELTCYWFSQGTAQAPECPAGYKTYCGYCGTETGQKPADFQYPCATGYISDKVEHISTAHFAAFPGNNNVAKVCGMCVEVTFLGKTITATVIDACPSCNSTGHLDLSLSAAEALGMVEWIGNPKQGVTWRAVACPVTDSIYVKFNGGYQGQVYFQNLAFPIAAASVDGKPANGSNAAFWDFGTDVSGKTVTLTDSVGHTVTGTIPTSKSGGSLGVQFPLTCQ